MATNPLLFCFYVVVAVLIVSSKGFAALHIKSVPQSINELMTDEITITCKSDGPAYWAKTVVWLQLMKGGQKPILVYGQQKLSSGPNMKTNMQGEGHIEQDASQSYIQLTIKNPGSDDSGTYTCLMFYVDESFQMRQEMADINVTIDNQHARILMKQLLDKISFLEEQHNTTKEQVFHLKTRVANQENQIRQLSQKENFTSAFFAGNTDTGILRKSQTLKFQDVKDNIGNDYDKETGVYTAPIHGLYAFHLFAHSYSQSNSGHKQTEVQIMVNTEVAATLIAEHRDYYDQPSVNRVIELESGDTVKCIVRYVNANDHRLNVFPYTAFSGHLINVL